MKKKLVIFGSADTGQLAHYYFNRFSDYEIAALPSIAITYVKVSFAGFLSLLLRKFTKYILPRNMICL